MLVYDAFEAQTTNSVKSLFKRENTDLAVIPGGLTSILELLDVSLNKPFKDGVRKWMQWMVDGIHEFTATRQQNNPSEELICSWISQAWNAIPHKMVTASFLKCGITNNLAGTEDTEELDDSFIRELCQLDSQLDVLRVQKYLPVSKQAFEFRIGLTLLTTPTTVVFLVNKIENMKIMR